MPENEAQPEQQSHPASEEQAAEPAANGSPPAPRPIRPCPYCGHMGENDGVQEQCSRCKGWFEPLSRQASQNSMGPWFFHDDVVPFRPGCSYETLGKLIKKERVTGDTLIRGPGSNQFWVFARHCPGVAHLLGVCHNCARQASESAFCCDHCGAAFPTYDDRQMLGLAPVRLLPGQANPDSVAASAMRSDDPLPRMKIDPDDSNYGPLAPTFASAAVEVASAQAESRGAPVAAREPSQETIDESPEQAAPSSIRGQRRDSRLKSTIGLLVLVIVVLLITVAALLLREPAPTPASAANATPVLDDQAPAPDATQRPSPWAERLDRAETLIATDDIEQLEMALTILRDVQENAPASDQPADLAERINAIASRVESENLRNFLEKKD